jgi:hypothetical protein
MNSVARSPMTDNPHELTTLQPAELGTPLTAKQLTARLAVIQDVMRNVMQKDADYGVIPGTQKPTLYKPGAEKLCVTFRLVPDQPLIDAVPELTGDVRYRVSVPIRASDGSIVAVGVGECSTGEEKYKWRRPVHENEYLAAPEDRKREKYQRDGAIWKQVRVEPADVANTVLKMAHKRAYVHAVIMATAAGAIFTQDIEDLPEGVADEATGDVKPPIQPPQRKSQAAPTPAPATSNGDAVKISEAQAKRFYAIAMGAGWSPDDLKRWLDREYGLASDRDIPRKRYDEIVAAMQAGAGA